MKKREPEPRRLSIGIATLAHPTHPIHDRHFALEAQAAFGVFDGLGSHKNPAKAAETARNFAAAGMSGIPDDRQTTPQLLGKSMQRLLLAADPLVEGSKGHATGTLAKLWQRQNGDWEYIVAGGGHEGASLFDGDTVQLTHLTLHESLRTLVDAGQLTLRKAFTIQSRFRNESDAKDLPPRYRRYADIYRRKDRYPLGDKNDQLGEHIPVVRGRLPRNGKLLLYSDGVPKHTRDENQSKILAMGLDNQAVADEIVYNSPHDALGASQDDSTLIVVSFEPVQFEPVSAAA